MGQLTFLVTDTKSNIKEDPRVVIKELSKTCNECRLSYLHPDNRGLILRGNPDGNVAVIGEAPGDTETERGQPLVGVSGREWDKWARFINLDQNRCLLTNVVQCQPGKQRVDGRLSQKPPDKDEIKACFGSRTLRVLTAMPNLEVVITLGWVAAKTILGGEPKGNTHEGRWFTTSILPNIAVFCMVHPAYLLREPSPEKTGRVEQNLLLFKREYLDSNKILDLMKEISETNG